jgi:hypothetical protein
LFVLILGNGLGFERIADNDRCHERTNYLCGWPDTGRSLPGNAVGLLQSLPGRAFRRSAVAISAVAKQHAAVAVQDADLDELLRDTRSRRYPRNYVMKRMAEIVKTGGNSRVRTPPRSDADAASAVSDGLPVRLKSHSFVAERRVTALRDMFMPVKEEPARLREVGAVTTTGGRRSTTLAPWRRSLRQVALMSSATAPKGKTIHDGNARRTKAATINAPLTDASFRF